MKLPPRAQQTLVALGAVLATACSASPARTAQKAEAVKTPDAIVELTGTLTNTEGKSLKTIREIAGQAGLTVIPQQDGTMKYQITDPKTIKSAIYHAAEKVCDAHGAPIPAAAKPVISLLGGEARLGILASDVLGNKLATYATVDTAINGRPSGSPQTVNCLKAEINTLPIPSRDTDISGKPQRQR